MCLCLQRDNTLDLLYTEPVTRTLVCRSELLNNRSLRESHIVFIGREDLMRMLLRGFLNHREQAALFLLTIDDEGAAEDLMTTVLRVDLCKTEDL